MAGLTNAIDYLLAAKGFGDPGSLDDVKNRGLLGGETLAALGAFAATSDLKTIFNDARIDNSGVIMSAEWAVQSLTPLA